MKILVNDNNTIFQEFLDSNVKRIYKEGGRFI